MSEAAPENVLAVHYEDLKQMGEAARDSLRRVARFLVGKEGKELERRVECATKHPEERFHRKTKSEEEGGSEGTSTARYMLLVVVTMKFH